VSKFSIIVPCYNLERWIRECLDSVLAQSFFDWECIVVDDESKDGSPAILDEYAARDVRVKVIHQKNAGEGGARNAGLAAATCEWIFFLDGDDVMAPGALEALSMIVAHYPTENLIRFGFENFDDGAAYPVVQRTDRVRGPVDISRQIAFEDFFVYVWQFLFRRSLIADMRFARYKRGADRAFIVPVLCFKAKSFIATEDVCYFYRLRQGSAMNARASVQVMKDELSHRVDVMEAIDQSGKMMPYAGSAWLEKYCLCHYLLTVEQDGSYSHSERAELIDWFYRLLPRICAARGFSCRGKICANLYARFPYEFARRLISSGFPRLLRFVSRIYGRRAT